MICPKGKGYESSREAIDGVEILLYACPEARGFASYLREYGACAGSAWGHNKFAPVLAGRPTRIFICEPNSLAAECGSGRPLRFRLLPLAYRVLMPLADACVAVSAAVAREMKELARSARPHRLQFRLAANYARFALDPAPYPWLDDNSGPVIVGVGRL